MCTRTVLLLTGVVASLTACTSPHRPGDFEQAIISGDDEAVARLIEQGVDVNRRFSHHPRIYGFRTEGWREEPPIVTAATVGGLKTVELLIRAGADVEATSTPLGWTALAAAARRSAPEAAVICQVLIQAGAVVRDKYLLYAAESGRHETVRLLLEHCADTKRGLLAARRRATYPRHLIIQMLGGDAWTDLMWAAGPYGSYAEVVLLLEQGADPNERSDEGWTALMSAVMTTDVGRVRALLDAGADVNAREDVRGTTPLGIAAKCGTLEIVNTLLEAGSELNTTSGLRRAIMWNARLNDTSDHEAVQAKLKAAIEAAPLPQAPDEFRLATLGPDRPWLDRTSAEIHVLHAEVAADRFVASGEIGITSNDLDYALDMHLRIDGREWPVHSFVSPTYGSHARFRVEIPSPLPATPVDIILRPNPALAVGTVETWEIWGEEIVIEDVRVTRRQLSHHAPRRR